MVILAFNLRFHSGWQNWIVSEPPIATEGVEWNYIGGYLAGSVQQPETSHFALGKPGAAGPPGREAKTAKWRDVDLAVLR